MSSRTPDARTRLPHEPYPGLRPFLDFEAALLFGRERQVREVIEHLRDTRFVAVLGGSGSGKSSLIHAGVTPQLRSFGIPGAGDLWLTMTCTPGTNVAPPAGAGARPRYTPVTRLAWKFSQLLKSRGSAEADARRVDEIAEVFRQEAGFARLADAYADELAVPPGPDPKEARLLFVVDQFEEIFHPTNKDVEDAAALVERVIDHFFNPHPRAYLVLTMRSEHLNDCAGFLELPDAINRSSYLVRRLDEAELREAIVGPAQRFLRLMARTRPEGEALPEEVRFEPAVLERLLRDVGAITHDPDHLPLLQHLLSRLWQAALAREAAAGRALPVPAEVTRADLEAAVAAGSAAPLEDRINTLRLSLENWAESAYRRRSPEAQAQFDKVLRRLAFKDPNTGMYTQQRIDVADAPRLLGAQATADDLRALVDDGFLGSVDYLFWDDEDPSRVTLKVSHESLIRGWHHFRELVDDEAQRFEEFVAALRKCADWVAGGRREDLLLEGGELRRLDEARVDAMLADPAQRAMWFRFLLLDRDGTRLARLQPEIDGFLRASHARQRGIEKASRRKTVGWLVTVALALVLLPSAMFSVLIQEPVAKRALLFFEAGNLVNATAQSETYTDANAGRDALKALLAAADLIDRGRTGGGDALARLSDSLLETFGAIRAVRRQSSLLEGVAALVEPPANGRLRDTLSSWLWKAGRPEGAPIVGPAPQPQRCAIEPGKAAADASAGLLFASTDSSSGARRYLFVPDPVEGRDNAVTLRVATFDATGSACTATQTVMAIPLFLAPRIAIDGSLRFFMFTQAAPEIEIPSVTLHEIDWERTEDGSSRMAGRRLRAVVLDREVVEALRASAPDAKPVVVPTYRSFAGRSFELGGGHWQIASASAQRLERRADGPLVALKPAGEGTPCGVLVAARPRQPGFEPRGFEHGRYCITVTERNAGPASREVLAAVFARPEAGSAEEIRERLRERPPAAIATMNQFARIAGAPSAWLVGERGVYEGWLAMRVRTRSGQEVELGLPWSTCALARVGAGFVGQQARCERD